jgi:recombinational DNA repair protein (RecF pathway)
MTNQEHILDGYFLARKPSSDTFEVWFLFTRQQGLVTCLHRQRSGTSRKNKGSADLWDHIELEWSTSSKAGEHGPRFVKDYRIVRHHEWLGQNWHRLEYASNLANLLRQNLAEHESRPELFQLTEQALDAWQHDTHPSAIYMKYLLRWIQQEGYGHPAQWRGATPASTSLWLQLTQHSVHTLSFPDIHWTRALDELETFLKQETEFHLH